MRLLFAHSIGLNAGTDGPGGGDGLVDSSCDFSWRGFGGSAGCSFMPSLSTEKAAGLAGTAGKVMNNSHSLKEILCRISGCLWGARR